MVLKVHGACKKDSTERLVMDEPFQLDGCKLCFFFFFFQDGNGLSLLMRECVFDGGDNGRGGSRVRKKEMVVHGYFPV